MTRKNTRAAIRRAVLSALTVLGLTGSAAAESYPSRAVRVIVPSSPGGAIDVTARIVSAKLSELWGQPVIIDNRPGGSMIIGATAASKATPDGYTLLVAHDGTMAMNPVIFPNVPYDSRSFEPISLVSSIPLLMMVHESVPAKSVKEFIELARKNPGRMNHATGGTGTLLALELFKTLAEVDIVNVPFRGTAPALTSTMAGDTQFIMADLTGAAPGRDSGKLRTIGVTTLSRLKQFPDLPTGSESGAPGFEYITWMAAFAPAGTPADIVRKVEDGIKQAVTAPDVRAKLERLGMEVRTGTSDELRELLNSDTEKWSKLVKQKNIKLEP
jgi:tripartite-type tricarboxylate transporter receptor subunit TctC